MNNHAELMKHKCEICGKAFFGFINLKFHIGRNHEGLKNLKCEICKKEFNTPASFKLHMKSVHKISNCM